MCGTRRMSPSLTCVDLFAVMRRDPRRTGLVGELGKREGGIREVRERR